VCDTYGCGVKCSETPHFTQLRNRKEGCVEDVVEKDVGQKGVWKIRDMQKTCASGPYLLPVGKKDIEWGHGVLNMRCVGLVDQCVGRTSIRTKQRGDE
jgi:hypothetical protein